jgi:ribosomal protein S12 methylthiotransferase accessory factor
MRGVLDLASPYVGIVRSVDERMIGTAEPPVPTFTAELAADDRLLGSSLTHVGPSSGLALDRSAAMAAALGEAAERYSLSYVPSERLRVASAADLGDAATDPASFGLFSEVQYARPGFPFVPFESTTPVTWVEGRRLLTGEPAWLPAELIFLADPVQPGAARVGYATSSGAACATTFAEAALRGLLEACERDAFAITWAARLSLPLLDWSKHRRLVELERTYFVPTGLAYRCIDLSSFHGLPSVLAVVRAPSTETAVLGVGAGTAKTIEQAWFKALTEAFGTRAAARHRIAGHRPLRDDGSDVVTFDDHIVFHAPAERRALSAFLDASAERRDVRAVKPMVGGVDERLVGLAERLEGLGLLVYTADATAPDIAAVGLRVVKAVVPGLCMLDVPHGGRFLGADRLRTVPHLLGHSERPLEEVELNPLPHPFP